MNRRAFLRGVAAAAALVPLAPLAARSYAAGGVVDAADVRWSIGYGANYRACSVKKLVAVIPVTDETLADWQSVAVRRLVDGVYVLS